MKKIEITEINPENLRQIIREEVTAAIQGNTHLSSTNEISSRQLLTVDQVCEYLGVSKSHLYKLTSKGLIPHFKPGKRIYFRKSELEEWVQQGRVDDLDKLRKDMDSHLIKNKRS